MTTRIDPLSPAAEHSSLLLMVVQTLRRRWLITTLSAAACWAIVAVVIALVAFAWIDVAVDLPGVARLVCDIALIVIGTGVLLRLGIDAFRGGSVLSVARRLDDAAHSRGQVASAVDLATSNPSASPLTAGLAKLAVRDATNIARGVQTAAAAPLTLFRRPAIIGAVVFMVLLFTLVGEPSLVITQFLRFVDPMGDHPPFTTLRFKVEPGDTSVLYGGSIDVRATVTGGAPQRLDLVLTDGDKTADPLPMFPEGEGKWRASLVSVTTPGRYAIRAGRARSAQYALNVITVPKLQDVTFRVMLPAYTNRPPYEGPLPQNGLAGLPGTIVQIHAKSNRPLSKGTVHFDAGSTTQPATDLVLSPIGPSSNECTGSFTIESAGKITIGVTDTAGQPSTETLSAAVTLLADERPFVRMVQPRAYSFATPTATVQCSALAEDDYGLSDVSIYRSLNDSAPIPIHSVLPPIAPTQFSATTNLKLSEYKLQPGDVIKVFARAMDNDPAGAKGSESPVVTLRIVSQQEMDKMTIARDGMDALQNKYAGAERRAEAAVNKLDQLTKELEKLDPTSTLAEDKRKEVEKAAEEMDQAAKEVQELADHELPFDVDHALSPQLKKLADQMNAAAAAAKGAAKLGTSVVGVIGQVQRIHDQLGIQKQQFHDDAGVPMEHLSKIFPLIEDQARFIDLYARQKDLADRLAGMANDPQKDDPQAKARMRDLEDEQKEIRHDLHQLLDDIDNHVAALPDDKRLDELRQTAKTFADAVSDSTAAGAMQTTERSLQDFDGKTASDYSKNAADTLSGFLERVKLVGGQGEACMKFDPKLAEAVGDTVQQMLGQLKLDMGLAGAGSGGGYSAMRSTMKNVGLYGALPTKGQESGPHGGDADHGSASNSNGGPDGNRNPDGATSAGRQQASGQSDAPVPPQYRKGVGEYFRRVADELAD